MHEGLANLSALQRSYEGWTTRPNLTQNIGIINRLNFGYRTSDQVLSEEIDKPCNWEQVVLAIYIRASYYDITDLPRSQAC